MKGSLSRFLWIVILPRSPLIDPGYSAVPPLSPAREQMVLLPSCPTVNLPLALVRHCLLFLVLTFTYVLKVVITLS